jgi:hypothetical protein
MTLEILLSLFIGSYVLTFILDPFLKKNPSWKGKNIFLLISLVLGLSMGFIISVALNLNQVSFLILGLTIFSLNYTVSDLTLIVKNRKKENQKPFLIDFKKSEEMPLNPCYDQLATDKLKEETPLPDKFSAKTIKTKPFGEKGFGL